MRGEAEACRGLKVDGQLELGRELYRQVAWVRAFENTIQVGGSLPELLLPIENVGHKATGLDDLRSRIKRWQLVTGGESNEQRATEFRPTIRRENESAARLARKTVDRRLNLILLMHRRCHRFHAEGRGRGRDRADEEL